MKKTKVVFACVLLLIAVLSGCNQNLTEPATQERESAVLEREVVGTPYFIEDEDNALEVFACSNKNRIGIERIVLFENRVVMVFDKAVCEEVDFRVDTFEYEYTPQAKISLNNVTKCEDLSTDIEEKGGKVIVTHFFQYLQWFEKDRKLDRNKSISIELIEIGRADIWTNNGNMVITFCYSYRKNDKRFFHWERQTYDLLKGEWGNIEESDTEDDWLDTVGD